MSASKPLIFIIDDDEAVRVALRRLISSFGYCVKSFASAREFLDSVPADAEGILILDVFMPQMSGLQLHEKLLSMGSKLKIIMNTAHHTDGDRKQTMSNDILAFLEKPVNDQELIDLLKSW